MKDPMYCVLVNAAEWKGTQHEEARKTHLSWYVKNLLLLLQGVDENQDGYVGKGYITVHSLLTCATVTGANGSQSWQ
eukprot:10042565-Heterocapsa_arctica.AAC.1